MTKAILPDDRPVLALWTDNDPMTPREQMAVLCDVVENALAVNSLFPVGQTIHMAVFQGQEAIPPETFFASRKNRFAVGKGKGKP